jgi:hypothetical protein
MEKTNISVTYKVKNYSGEEYDTKIPVELVEAFAKLKEKLVEVSNGRYECTPFVFDPESQGLLTGIMEVKETHHTKLPFYLCIK